MIFIFPTETSYGIGCDARDPAMVTKIFNIKGRTQTKTMPLIAASQKMAEKYANVRAKEIKRVMKKYWPGPLTLVLTASAYAKKTLARGVIAADGTIAIRVPASQLARELSKEMGAPIVATSANKTGEPACYSAGAVRRMFKNTAAQADIFFDGGRIPKRPASTIARHTKNKWEILRRGEIVL